MEKIYRNRALSARGNQQLLASGRWTMDTIDKIARDNAKWDDRMEKVSSIADRYANNAMKYLAKKGIDATQQGFDWSPQQRIGVPQKAYIGLNNG